jgi:hypothetical protein
MRSPLTGLAVDTGLSLGGSGFQVLAVAAAEHIREPADGAGAGNGGVLAQPAVNRPKGYRKYSPEFREEIVKMVVDTS